MNETVAPPPPSPPGVPPHEPPGGSGSSGGSGPGGPGSSGGPGGEAPRSGMNTAALGDYRSLRRSATDRKVAGVAGGLARHLDVDPLLVRVLLFVLVFFGGAGLLVYAALWVLVPDERDGHVVLSVDESTRNVLVIVALVVAALIAFTTGIGNDTGGVWFVGIVAIGGLAFYLTRQSRRQSRAASPGTGSQWTGSQWTAEQGAPPATPTWTPPPSYYAWTPRRRRGPLLFLPTLALVALGLGVLGLLDSNGTSVPDAAYPALALAIIGTMLVVGSFFGRAGGLVLLALVSLAALLGSAVAEPSYSGSREVRIAPTSSTAIPTSYDLPAGQITVDLTKLSEPDALKGRTLDLHVNAGEIVVIVPGDVDVAVDADIRYGGAIDTPDGITHDGWGTDVQRTYDGPPSTTGAPLELDLSADFGHIDVRRG